MTSRLTFFAVLVGLLLNLVLAVNVSAAPPAQGGGYWRVGELFVELFTDQRFAISVGKVWRGGMVEVLEAGEAGRRVGVVQYTRDAQKYYAAEGWVAEAAFGTSLAYLGTSLPVAVIAERGAEYMQPISNCQVWLECNGESPMPQWAQQGWDWLDRNGIFTAHPEDCIPYRNMPRPPGCYP